MSLLDRSLVANETPRSTGGAFSLRLGCSPLRVPSGGHVGENDLFHLGSQLNRSARLGGRDRFRIVRVSASGRILGELFGEAEVRREQGSGCLQKSYQVGEVVAFVELHLDGDEGRFDELLGGLLGMIGRDPSGDVAVLRGRRRRGEIFLRDLKPILEEEFARVSR